MAIQDAKIQEEVVQDLEKVADFLSQRIEKLKVELENRMAANREMDIKIILHELMAGRRTSIADLPADVRRDLGSLIDKCIKDADEYREKLAGLEVEGSAAAAAPVSGGEPRD